MATNAISRLEARINNHRDFKEKFMSLLKTKGHFLRFEEESGYQYAIALENDVIEEFLSQPLAKGLHVLYLSLKNGQLSINKVA